MMFKTECFSLNIILVNQQVYSNYLMVKQMVGWVVLDNLF